MATPTDEEPDWPLQATQTIVGFVDDVKNKTTRPAALVSRALVYGIVIIAVGVPMLIMLVIGLVRFLDFAIPQEVWLVYLILGSIFTLAGLFMWRKRTP